MALLSSPTKTEAYQKLHPNASRETAQKNCSAYFKDVDREEFTNVIRQLPNINIAADLIIKSHILILQSWIRGDESATVAQNSLRELARLCPEFIDKSQVNVISNLKGDALERELKSTLSNIQNVDRLKLDGPSAEDVN